MARNKADVVVIRAGLAGLRVENIVAAACISVIVVERQTS